MRQILEDGLKQTRAYMDRCDPEEGHLIVFDRRQDGFIPLSREATLR